MPEQAPLVCQALFWAPATRFDLAAVSSDERSLHEIESLHCSLDLEPSPNTYLLPDRVACTRTYLKALHLIPKTETLNMQGWVLLKADS